MTYKTGIHFYIMFNCILLCPQDENMRLRCKLKFKLRFRGVFSGNSAAPELSWNSSPPKKDQKHPPAP